MAANNRKQPHTYQTWTSVDDDEIKADHDTGDIPTIGLSIENDRQRLRYAIMLDWTSTDFLEKVAGEFEAFARYCRNVAEVRRLQAQGPEVREYQTYDDHGDPAGIVIVGGGEVRA